MAEHVTRCPHCQTSFRVRDEHLSVARGNVRCGSCLQVFNATEHFVADKPAVARTPASRPAAEQSTLKATTQTAQKPGPTTPDNTRAAGTRTGSQRTESNQQPPASVAPARPVSNSKAAAVAAADNPADDFGGINLNDQTEVSADELFDSMFGSFDDDDSAEPDNIFDYIEARTDSEKNQSVPTSDFVFSSADSFQDTYNRNRAAAMAAEQVQPEADDFDDDQLIHDDMDEDDHINDDPFADLGLREPEKRRRPAPMTGLDLDHSLIEMVEQENPLAVSARSNTREEVRNDDEEAWARALLEDDEPPENITRELGLKPNPGSQPPAAATQEKTGSSTAPRTPVAPTSSATPVKPVRTTTETSASASAGAATRRQPVSFGLAEDQPEPEYDSQSILGAPLTDHSRQTPPVKPREVAGSLQPDPLKLALPGRSKLVSGWTWGSAALLMLAALQIFYFSFDDWARTPRWRPLYTTACSVVGCTLPTIQDVNSLRARNLVVRSHPSLANALVVDTLLQNEAEYDQPFPDLTLIFRDLDDNVVASRRFTPDEYLAGEVAGINSIPARTPVHIALEILDPGQNAVSYSIQLVGNQ
jgi:predicted Zn finger-like uncharacterized protein